MDTPESEDLWCQIGSFEPTEARRLLPLLQQAQIPFELEGDHSRLLAPGRFLQLEFGLYPEGSKLNVFVPQEHELQAQQIVISLFPL
jgi:hypothetical protein